ncbi:MAG: hypothetical protein HC851_09140 [Acaryochloris sp. RU_4_1]|nr:hypothetical protein [Acaryochloris sp. RU_4_1]NJR54585.1 hypothetical protein [Acaryochloris sp. CRU_2_0]
MASPQQVKEYLACWLQLGKPIRVGLQQEPRQVERVIQGDQYSPEFEALWRYIRSPESGDCYLEGMDPTIAELLSDRWEILECARCQMPTYLPSAGIASPLCPCHDLGNWPNNELPQPRAPVDSAGRLWSIHERLTSSL